MKVALTVWENWISPVADSARKLVVADIGTRGIRSRALEHFSNESIFFRARKLADLKINILICGAISDLYAGLVKGYGIKVVRHIRGPVDEVLDAYVRKRLSQPRFVMIGALSRNMMEDESRET